MPKLWSRLKTVKNNGMKLKARLTILMTMIWLMPLMTFSQNVMMPVKQPKSFRLAVIDDTTRFCFTSGQTKFFVKQTHQNQIHTADIIDLKSANTNLLNQISGLNNEIEILSEIDTAQIELTDIVDERRDLTDKERRRIKRRAKWSDVWSKGKEIFIGVTSGIAGFGVGYGVGTLK